MGKAKQKTSKRRLPTKESDISESSGENGKKTKMTENEGRSRQRLSR